MSDDSEKPPAPPIQPQLEYWHSDSPLQLHPFWLVAYTGMGLLVGVFAAGYGLGILSNVFAAVFSKWLTACLMLAVAVIGCAAFFFMLSRRINKDRGLSLENRRRGPRFFELGFCAGCGLVCLLVVIMVALFALLAIHG